MIDLSSVDHIAGSGMRRDRATARSVRLAAVALLGFDALLATPRATGEAADTDDPLVT